MHDNPGDQQGKAMVQHSCKSSCSKWGTSRVKEEINTQEANDNEDGEDVFHKLPGAKKKQPTNKHNLLEAVKNIRGQKKALIKRIHFEFIALISR